MIDLAGSILENLDAKCLW